MRGVFGYCGKPFDRLVAGRSETTHGWLDLKRHHFPMPVGPRLLGSCDVPDLVLFPRRYPGVETVTFHAGFAGAPGHLFIWMAAQLARIGVLHSLVPLGINMSTNIGNIEIELRPITKLGNTSKLALPQTTKYEGYML